MQYPLPAHAASIWLAGDKLNLAFPGSDDHVRGHSVVVQIDISAIANLLTSSRFAPQVRDDRNQLMRDERATLRGLYAILNALRERANTSAKSATISKPSAPTQYDLDAIMRAVAAGAVRRIEPRRAAPEDLSLDDLGL